MIYYDSIFPVEKDRDSTTKKNDIEGGQSRKWKKSTLHKYIILNQITMDFLLSTNLIDFEGENNNHAFLILVDETHLLDFGDRVKSIQTLFLIIT